MDTNFTNIIESLGGRFTFTNVISNDIWRFIYQFAYEFARNHTDDHHYLLLPEMHQIHHLYQNQHSELRKQQLRDIRYLQSELGIVFWHYRFIQKPWNYSHNGSFVDYIEQFEQAVVELFDAINPAESGDMNLWIVFIKQLRFKFVWKLFDGDYNFYAIMIDDLDQNSMDGITDDVYNLIRELCKTDNFDSFEKLMKRLKANDCMVIFRDFGDFRKLLNELDRFQRIRFIKILIEVNMHDPLDAFIIHVIAKSFCQWFEENMDAALNTLKILAKPKYFRIYLLRELCLITETYLLHDAQITYLWEACQSLSQLRSEWSGYWMPVFEFPKIDWS